MNVLHTSSRDPLRTRLAVPAACSRSALLAWAARRRECPATCEGDASTSFVSEICSDSRTVHRHVSSLVPPNPFRPTSTAGSPHRGRSLPPPRRPRAKRALRRDLGGASSGSAGRCGRVQRPRSKRARRRRRGPRPDARGGSADLRFHVEQIAQLAPCGWKGRPTGSDSHRLL
jgi:hypothetical protein